MKVFHLGVDVIPFDSNTSITVGTFDGVHLGHQQILKSMVNNAATKNQRTVVVTFHPHPQIVLAKDGRKPLRLLSTIEERLTLLQRNSIDIAIVIPFTIEFSKTTASDFVKKIVVGEIGVSDFFIGHDHSFGQNRGGDEELLNSLAPECNFNVFPVDPFTIEVESEVLTISSTRIRQFLQEGNVEGAMHLLGRPYSITGTVVKGVGRGRTLGIPTANVVCAAQYKILPSTGVYVVSAVIEGSECIGMANIGTRPTFTDDTENTLEVHFLNFDTEIYNEEIQVNFHRFLRSEQRFESREAFLAQLGRDKEQTVNFTLTYFNRSSS